MNADADAHPAAAPADPPRPAWVVGHISIKDAARWVEYRDQVPGTLQPFGAELVFRGRRHEVLGGSYRHGDTVTLKFPSIDAARAWHASAAYQALLPLRHAAAEVDLVLFEG
jgi:uncharacterized protein (DUF1330 family)